MRQLVFVNSASVSTTIGNNTYTITSLYGLSTPSQVIQEQKAPFQDGATYIDTLFNPREVVCEGAINAKTLAAINAAKDALIKALSPKLGQGWLTYTASGGVVRKIQCVASIIFGNKDAREPFQKFQIVFRAGNPYWLSTSSSTINLPTYALSTIEDIYLPATGTVAAIQKSNGNMFVIFTINDADTENCDTVSSEYTTSWGSPQTIVAGTWPTAPTSLHALIQLSSGNLLFVYKRPSDNYLVSREYSSSWGSESVINNASTERADIIQKSNGNLLVIYRRNSDGKLVTREYTSSWSAESATISAVGDDQPCLIQKTDGNLLLVYIRAADGYIVSREYTSSWSGETVVNAADSDNPRILQKTDGTLFLSYIRASDGYLVSRTYRTSWSSEAIIQSTVAPTFIYDIRSVLKSDGSIIFVFRQGSYIRSIERTIATVDALVTGHTETSVKIVFNGPSVNPRLIHNGTLEFIRFNKTLLAGDTITIDTDPSGPSAVLVDSGVTKNGMIYLDLGSTFFSIQPGSNLVSFDDESVLPAATATMEWYERYIGC